MNAFARRVLQACRGNLEDVNQGVIFYRFIEQHNIEENQLDSTLVKQIRVQPDDHDWLN
jgi:hypothetical protein